MERELCIVLSLLFLLLLHGSDIHFKALPITHISKKRGGEGGGGGRKEKKRWWNLNEDIAKLTNAIVRKLGAFFRDFRLAENGKEGIEHLERKGTTRIGKLNRRA